ncbi:MULTISPECIES: sugar kinase [unclassified Microbacterium]|uniref:sugar kinase n=1 Tax=unclassified Microbacterium TaxID=2609290 RepID=UPI0030173ED7
MGTILTAGETMAMLTPRTAQPVLEAQEFRLEAGGAESNVAVHVAALGHHAHWFSRLGADELGTRILHQLARNGVIVDHVVLDAVRPTGLYVKSPGIGVSYYRRGSAASALDAKDVESMPLTAADVVHVSGITAALSASARAFLDAVFTRARSEGIPISFDVNYRAPLWPVSDAAPVLRALAERADIVFVGRDEAETLWGCFTADEVHELLPDVPELVVKDGSVGAWSTVRGQSVFISSHRVEVVEPVGAGDAFSGGYLAALLDGASVADRLRAGHDRAALVLGTTADFIEERTERTKT